MTWARPKRTWATIAPKLPSPGFISGVPPACINPVSLVSTSVLAACNVSSAAIAVSLTPGRLLKPSTVVTFVCNESNVSPAKFPDATSPVIASKPTLLKFGAQANKSVFVTSCLVVAASSTDKPVGKYLSTVAAMFPAVNTLSPCALT